MQTSQTIDQPIEYIYLIGFIKLITVLLNFIKKIAIEIEKIKLFDFFPFQISYVKSLFKFSFL